MPAPRRNTSDVVKVKALDDLLVGHVDEIDGVKHPRTELVAAGESVELPKAEAEALIELGKAEK